jgi:glycosyltransferase involved in cell wall biosynthesis
MLAAVALRKQPLAVSIWGNDFTLHAVSSPVMRRRTRQTMKKATALHADCRRDLRLAEEWGLKPAVPSILVPGNGGVRTDVFNMESGLAREPIVLNPRGSRVYVRNDVFFRAIPLILARRPEARFVCASMAGDPEAVTFLRRLSIGHAVQLLEPAPQSEMAAIYQRAQVLVSPSIHDGTPNTLLEGMACGCFPVVGDLESVREWITHGHNGLLMDPTDPESIAEAVLIALDREDLRREAAGLNSEIIAARAEFTQCMAQVRDFYASVARF